MTADKDAARYRTRLRDTEAEHARLTATLTTLQRGAVESLAAERGVNAQALWAVTELDGLLDDDGNPNPAAVTAAADTAAERFGITPTTARDGIGGLRSGTMNPPAPTNRWADAFRPADQ